MSIVVENDIDLSNLPDKTETDLTELPDKAEVSDMDWSGLPDKADVATPRFEQAPEPSIWENFWNLFREAPEKEIAKAQNAVAINQSLPQIPISMAYERQDDIFSELKNRNLTIEDFDKYALPKLDWTDKVEDIKERPGQLLPFYAGASDAMRLYRLKNAIDGLDNNKGITEQEKNDLILLREFVDESNRDTTFGYKVASILSMLPSFAGELYATGGIYTIGRAGTVKATSSIATKILGKTGQKVLNNKLALTGLKLISEVGGRAAQGLVAGSTRIVAGTIKNMTDEFKLTDMEQGELQGIITGEGDDLSLALVKAIGEQEVETLSEFTGPLFTGMAKPVKNIMIKSSLFKVFKKINPSAGVSDFRKIVEKMGYHGVLEEMLEERVADIGHGVLESIGLGDQKFKWPSLEQLGAELVAFSIPGAGFKTIEYLKSLKEEKIKEPSAEVRKSEIIEAEKPPEQPIVKEPTHKEIADSFAELSDEEMTKRAEELLPAPSEALLEPSPLKEPLPSEEIKPAVAPIFEETTTVQGKRMSSLMGANDNMIVAKDEGKELGYFWYTKEPDGGFSVRKVESFVKEQGVATALTNEVVAKEGVIKGFTDVTPEGLAFFKAYAEKYPENVSPEFKQRLAELTTEREGGAVLPEFELAPTEMPTGEPKTEDILEQMQMKIAQEAIGKGTLEDLILLQEEQGYSPQKLINEFLSKTYPNLNEKGKKYFDKLIERVYGKPDNYLKTHIEVLKNDIIDKFEYLEGRERGLYVLIYEANKRLPVIKETDFELAPTEMPVEKPKPAVQPDLIKGIQPEMPKTAIETKEVGHPMLEEITKREEEKRQLAIPEQAKVIKEKKPVKANPETDSLATYIRKNGGFNYQKEHMKGELDRLSKKEAGTTGLISKSGKGYTLDQMLEKAIEDGYFNENATVNDLIDVLENEVYMKKKHYSTMKVWTDEELGEMMMAGMVSEEKNIGSLLTDLNDAIGEAGIIGKGGADISKVMPILSKIGNKIYTEGHKTYEQFSNRMKEISGTAYSKIKDYLYRIWQAVKQFNERLGERGAVGEQIPFFPEAKPVQIPKDISDLRQALVEAAKAMKEARRIKDLVGEKKARRRMEMIIGKEIKTKNELEAKERLEELDKGDVDLSAHLLTHKKSELWEEFKKRVDKTIGIVSTRLKNIHPEIKDTARKYVYKVEKLIAANEETSYDFIKGFSKLDDKTKIELSHALLDGNKEKADRLASKYGLLDSVNKVRDMLPQIRQRAIDAGFEVGEIENYWPRVVKDPEGLLSVLRGTSNWTAISEAIDKAEKKTGKDLSDSEKAQIADMLLRGYPQDKISITLPKSSAFKQRTLERIPKQLLGYYMPADQSLISHIKGMNNTIEAANFFGKFKDVKDVDEKINLELFNDNILQKSIGDYIIDLKNKGFLKREDEKILREILQAIFKPARVSGMVRMYKNLTYLQLLTQITPAITQLGDIALTAEKAGYFNTLRVAGKAIIGKSDITLKDVNVTKILEEFDGGIGKLGHILEKSLKWTGFSAIDRIGKESLLNAKMLHFQQQARSGDKILEIEINRIFGEEAGKVMKELREGRKTDNTLFLLWNKLSDTQPISRLEVPEKYLTSDVGKVFYALKTYQLKLLDIYRNDVWYEIKNGNKLLGFKKLISLSVALISMGALADEIKDFILGRKTDFSDKVWDNLLRLGGFSKYTMYKVRKEGLSKGLIAQFAPPAGFIDPLTKDIDELIRKGELEKGARTTQSLPVVGKTYYYWFGRGAWEKKKNK